MISNINCTYTYCYLMYVCVSADPGKLFVVSTRDIKAGEEIFYSYGYDYWRGRVIKGY